MHQKFLPRAMFSLLVDHVDTVHYPIFQFLLTLPETVVRFGSLTPTSSRKQPDPRLMRLWLAA